MDRRSWAPAKIYELIKDLKTLTGIDPKEWEMSINDEKYACEVDIMKDKMILNPNLYKMEEEADIEDDLNEMRLAAGLDHKSTILEKDTYIKDLQAAAGL